MVLGREFEEMCAQMYYRGKMFGFVHLYSGQVRQAEGRRGGRGKEGEGRREGGREGRGRERERGRAKEGEGSGRGKR